MSEINGLSAEARDVSPLDGTVLGLTEALDALDKALGALKDRLSPVLSGLEKGKQEQTDSPPTRASSPLGNRIASAEKRTRAHVTQVTDLIAALET